MFMGKFEIIFGKKIQKELLAKNLHSHKCSFCKILPWIACQEVNPSLNVAKYVQMWVDKDIQFYEDF